jgi:acyl-CoA thioester hydrolase
VRRQPPVRALSADRRHVLPHRTFESEALVRFSDCDPLNHLNNARYFDYFMNAREDHLLKGAGFSLYEAAQERGVGWVVGSHHIAYLRPAMLMETVVIDSTMLAWRERDVLVELRMWDRAKTDLKALLWSTFVHVDLKTGRSIRHSDEYTRRFKPYEAPLPDPPPTFDERLAALRAGTRA